MKKEDKLVLGTLAGVNLILSPEHQEEYKGTLNKKMSNKNEHKIKNWKKKIKKQKDYKI